MSNSTSCVTFSNCTIVDGPTTNGTFYVPKYDPYTHAPFWHQRLELAIFCIFNSLSVILITARIVYRWVRFRRFRGDDRWMAAAGLILICYTVSQIYSNRFGSGLHMKNVKKPWLEGHWKSEFGWVGYYIVVSIIKISVCFTFIEILPSHFKALRYTVYSMAVFIASLGITLTCGWLFQCQPFLSNFLWSVNATSCVNYDYFRWTWIGLSLSIDIFILAVPLQILKRTLLKAHERKILRLIFSANLLGTITCAMGIYGVWEDRTGEANDWFYHEALFLMFNDIEMFMYALGASFPVLSRHFVSRSDPSRESNSNFSSWARNVPDFFVLEPAVTRTLRSPTLAESHLGSQVSVRALNLNNNTDHAHEHHFEKGLTSPEP